MRRRQHFQNRDIIGLIDQHRAEIGNRFRDLVLRQRKLAAQG